VIEGEFHSIKMGGWSSLAIWMQSD